MILKNNANKSIKSKFVRGLPGHVLKAEYFYFETEPKNKNKLAIVCGGYEKCAPDYLINRRSYPYYVIKYTLNGKGIFTINSREYLLKSGSLSGFCPKDTHRYCSNHSNPLEHIFIIFTGTEAEQLFKQSTIMSKGKVDVSSQSECVYILKAIMKTGIEKVPFSQEICCDLLRVLLLKQAAGNNTSEFNFTRSMDTYQRCKKYIDDNFTKIFSPAETADACAVDIRYMARLFRKYSKITPHEYIMRLKLNKASAMLLTSSFSINEIGYALGFNDPYHFSRVFKKFHGLAPKNYRKLYIEYV